MLGNCNLITNMSWIYIIQDGAFCMSLNSLGHACNVLASWLVCQHDYIYIDLFLSGQFRFFMCVYKSIPGGAHIYSHGEKMANVQYDDWSKKWRNH